MGLLVMHGGRGRAEAAASASIRTSTPRGSLNRSTPRLTNGSFGSAWATPTQTSSNEDLRGLERTITRTTGVADSNEDAASGASVMDGNSAMDFDEEDESYDLVDNMLDEGVEGSFWDQASSEDGLT